MNAWGESGTQHSRKWTGKGITPMMGTQLGISMRAIMP